MADNEAEREGRSLAFIMLEFIVLAGGLLVYHLTYQPGEDRKPSLLPRGGMERNRKAVKTPKKERDL